MRAWPPPNRAEPSNEGALRPETVKHYLETIFYIQFEEDRVRPGRIAEWLGLRPPTVSVTLHRLERDGWIQVESDRTVSLTDEGMALASGVVRVHRLLERWLTDVLGFDWATADNYAQEIAPGMSDAVAERLDEHLGRPSTCPAWERHPGSHDRAYGELELAGGTPPRTEARVRRISEVAEHDAPDLLRRLDGNGLVTGAQVVVAEDGSSEDAVTVDIGDHTMALGISTARLIWVEPEGSASRRRGGGPTARPPSSPDGAGSCAARSDRTWSPRRTSVRTPRAGTSASIHGNTGTGGPRAACGTSRPPSTR